MFPLNASWIYVNKEYNIGRVQGNKLELTPTDKDELLAVVKQATGLDMQQHKVADFKTLHRDQVLSIANNEKLAGLAVKQDRLAIKALPGQTLNINNQAYTLPDRGHLDIALADIEITAHPVILLIENYHCFDAPGTLRLKLPEVFADPLILYRGDTVYSEQTVRRLLTKLNLPVLVMADLDPQGLVIAQSFPHIVGLIAPSPDDLAILLKNTHIANAKLYEKQYAGCRNALAASPHAAIRQLWEMMKQHRAGIVQEYWLHGHSDLVVYSY